ncbi:hypothetical protein EI94DRAFT_1791441 [Lactarius quietus]|nr:hypothetical protein EI94DRAFT_1791441 [Lactarius quietus]
MTRPTVTAVILYPGSDRNVSHVPGNLSATLSYVVNFKLMDSFRTSHPNDADELECLCLLHQFSTVQALYASREIAECFASELNTTTGEILAEALSSLDLICLEDQPTSSVEKFFAFRQLSGRPVTIVSTEEEFDQRLVSESYVAVYLTSVRFRRASGKMRNYGKSAVYTRSERVARYWHDHKIIPTLDVTLASKGLRNGRKCGPPDGAEGSWQCPGGPCGGWMSAAARLGGRGVVDEEDREKGQGRRGWMGL